MAINSTTRRAGPFSGDGVTTQFPFGFKVFTSADVLVVRTSSAGVDTELVLNRDYTVTLSADQTSAPGGQVLCTTALAVGEKLNLTSALAPLQPVQLTNLGGFYPRVIEDALDRLTILLQQFGAVGVMQAVRAPEIGGIRPLPAAADRAGMFLSFDSSGDPVVAHIGTGTAADLAAYMARGFAIDGSDNLVVNNRVTTPRIVATATDDSGTPDAAIRVSRTLSAVTIGGGHDFRADTTVTGGVAGTGHAAFDAANTLSATGFDHIVSFQSRPVVNGNPTHVYGVSHAPTFGAGANAVNSYGLFPFNPTGAGTVQNVYGLYVPIQSKGSVGNWPIYVAQQGAPSFFGSPVQVNNLLTVNPAVPFIIGGSTTTGFPWYGYNYDPAADDKKINDVAVATKLDTAGMRVYVKPGGAPLGASGMLATMTEALKVDTTGAVFVPAVGTTASAANAFIDNTSSNKILRSTSSARYKREIEDVAPDASARIWGLRPVRYRSLAPADNGGWSYYGLIAEEVAAIEPRLVHWSYRDEDWQQVEQRTERPILVDTGVLDVDSRPILRPDVEVTTETTTQLRDGAQLVPDGVQYERLVVLLLAEVRALRERVAALETQGGA